MLTAREFGWILIGHRLQLHLGEPVLNGSVIGLFARVQPALVQPEADVVPLTSDADTIEFTDAQYTDGMTYGWELAYVDGTSAYPVQGSFFFDTEGGTFRLAGPLAPIGADGGPYAGILTVTATTAEGTTELAQVCVALAKDG